jgi:hypothetical protein
LPDVQKSIRAKPLFSRLAALSVLLAGARAVLFYPPSSPPRWPDAVRPATAMGDSTCISCHRDKASFESSAHRRTMRLPTRQAIAGSFRSGENVLHTANPALHFRMDADSAGFLESAVVGKGPDTSVRTERIAYVAGSARKGQSFLYWSGDRLYQLPVSYWTSLRTWINSPGPGYQDGNVNFRRGIAPRCLECHSTWMEWVPDLTVVNRFRPEGAILGITCERCHGAGREHVTHERSLLHAFESVAIVNPARLNRARKMDTCAQCHAGLGDPKVPSFTYVAGQILDHYLTLEPQQADAPVDVHGNQVALLERSRCFRSSQMTCTTCHDVHRTQRDVTEISGRCLTCHQEQSCGLYPTRGHALAGHCVDCHMPLQSSNRIVSSLEGKDQHVQVRTHWIRVYPLSVTRDSTTTAPARH